MEKKDYKKRLRMGTAAQQAIVTYCSLPLLAKGYTLEVVVRRTHNDDADDDIYMHICILSSGRYASYDKSNFVFYDSQTFILDGENPREECYKALRWAADLTETLPDLETGNN